MRKKNELERILKLGERTPFLQRWPIILFVLLLVWPLGLVLLILKIMKVVQTNPVHETKRKDIEIPYENYKSQEKKTAFLEKRKYQKKQNLTSALVVVLLLGLGCFGLTKLYIYLFEARILILDFVQSFLWQLIFLVCGVYLSFRMYKMLQCQHTASRILTNLNNRTSISIEQLAQSLGCVPADLKDTLRWMISMDYFGDDADLDYENKMLYCTIH